MKNFIKRLKVIFFAELDSKPTWGREQVKNIFLISIVNAMLDKKVDGEN